MMTGQGEKEQSRGGENEESRRGENEESKVNMRDMTAGRKKNNGRRMSAQQKERECQTSRW